MKSNYYLKAILTVIAAEFFVLTWKVSLNSKVHFSDSSQVVETGVIQA